MTKILFLKDAKGEQYYAKTHREAIDNLHEATTQTSGLMSAEDKVKLDQLNSDDIYLNSPSGEKFKLQVDDLGQLIVTKVEEEFDGQRTK